MIEQKELIANDLDVLHTFVRNDIENWRSRNERVGKNPPWPADSPCYYCGLLEDRDLREKLSQSPCCYCIHNPNAEIFK